MGLWKLFINYKDTKQIQYNLCGNPIQFRAWLSTKIAVCDAAWNSNLALRAIWINQNKNKSTILTVSGWNIISQFAQSRPSQVYSVRRSPDKGHYNKQRQLDCSMPNRYSLADILHLYAILPALHMQKNDECKYWYLYYWLLEPFPMNYHYNLTFLSSYSLFRIYTILKFT